MAPWDALSDARRAAALSAAHPPAGAEAELGQTAACSRHGYYYRCVLPITCYLPDAAEREAVLSYRTDPARSGLDPREEQWIAGCRAGSLLTPD